MEQSEKDNKEVREEKRENVKTKKEMKRKDEKRREERLIVSAAVRGSRTDPRTKNLDPRTCTLSTVE